MYPPAVHLGGGGEGHLPPPPEIFEVIHIVYCSLNAVQFSF